MRGLPQFLSSITKYKIFKPDEVISSEKSILRFDPAGFYLSRAINMASYLPTLFKEIQDRIPYTPSGGQPIISTNYEKISVLFKFLDQTINELNSKLPGDQAVGKELNNGIAYFASLKDSLKCLASSQAPNMAQILDQVQRSVSYVENIVSSLVSSLGQKETSLLPTISQPQMEQIPLIHSFAASLVSMDLLAINLMFLSTFDGVQSESVLQCSALLMHLSFTLHQQPREGNSGLYVILQTARSQMPQISNFVSALQQQLPDKPDFVKTCLALATVLQNLNDMEIKIKNKEITELIRGFSQALIAQKPLDSFLNNSTELIKTFYVNLQGDAASAYGTLFSLSQICSSDSELTALTIASICRFCATQVPDAYISEELLLLLCTKVADITKTIYSESRQIVLQLISVIDANLEFFNDEFLGEINYVLTGAKNVMDFVSSDPNFVLQQQLFFDALGSIPSPLTKLLSTCVDIETKSQLGSICEKLVILSNRYSKWLMQFYLSSSAIVFNRSENLLYLLSYPVMMLCAMGMQQFLGVSLDALKGLQATIQGAPQYSVTDLAAISKLVDHLGNFSAPSNQFIEIANRNNESIFFPLFKNASIALSKAITPLPSFCSSLPSLVNFTNSDSFVCSVRAISMRALNVIQETQSIIERTDPTVTFFLSVPFTMTFMCDALIRAQQPYASALLNPITAIKNTTEVIWPIARALSSNTECKDRSNLPTYVSRYITSLSELISSIGQLSHPSIPYKIPDDIQEIKKFDSMADSIHSSLVKSFAKYIVKSLKRSKSSDVRFVLSQWFEATQVQTVDVSEAISKLENSILQLMTSATTDRTQFIEQFASLSVSLAATENSYGKTVSPHVQRLHKELVTNVQEMLENTRSTAQGQLTKIISGITMIKSLAPISKLKQKEIDSYLAMIISKIIKSLNSLRVKSRDSSIHDFISAIRALSEYEALCFIAPQDIDSKPILALVSQAKSVPNLDSFISQFSQKLIQLEPSQFNMLDTIRDTDTICDYVYDKAEAFREEVNNIINLAKTPSPESSPTICASLKKMMLYSADSAVLTMHSLMICGLAFSQLSRTLVECYSELTSSFYEFVSTSFKIPTSKDDLGSELRRINRKMSKQFDTLINIVENPVRPTGDIPEFEGMKNQMYADLCTVSIQLARLIALSSSALVPEMWVSIRSEIIDTLSAAQQQLSGSVTTVRSKAVGSSSTELGALMTKLESQISPLITTSENLDFSAPFPPVKVLPPAQQISLSLYFIAKLSPSLTDRIIIEPDPAAASKVPDDYSLPSLPEKAISPTDALDEMELAKRHLDQEIVQFKNVTDANLSSSGELLNALISLRKAASTYSEKALSMARSTVEARSQVEQQATLHGYANSLSMVFRAMKSRLMRTQNFQAEMDEALSSLRSTTETTMRIAVDASKIEVEVVEDGSMDDVTRELMATSKAIEEMTSRLSQFASQVDIESVQTEETVDDPQNAEIAIPEIKAEAGTLPAFLIASAHPILDATAKILIRAREITISLIQKFGKIDNESGMIKCAQDLSEAAELLIICAEVLVNASEADAEFKVIAASRIIKASVSALVAQVLVKGGDAEGIMNQHVRIVVRHTDAIIRASEKIVEEKLNEADAKEPKKAVKNPMILKLNMQQQVTQLRKVLQEEEKNLYQFRRRGNK